MNELPLVCAALPGTGGAVKERPSDFVVEELPLYEPCGSGEHVYLRIEREGLATRELVVALGKLFRLPSRAIGTAGLKDKRARATQSFSLHLHEGDPQEIARRVEAELDLRVSGAVRHVNKLRTGHLLGNRFRVLLRGAGPDALARGRAIAAQLEAQGLPNAFGPQRFGAKGDNAERGRALLSNPRKGWSAGLLYSAWQSQLFHEWLVLRHARASLPQLLPGDVAKRHDGPLFDVEDLAAEEARRRLRDIVPTGPLYGAEMRWAKGPALELEREVFAASGVDAGELARAGLAGSRRAAWIYPRALVVEEAPEGLWVGFELNKGSYATVVLREFTRERGLSAD